MWVTDFPVLDHKLPKIATTFQSRYVYSIEGLCLYMQIIERGAWRRYPGYFVQRVTYDTKHSQDVRYPDLSRRTVI